MIKLGLFGGTFDPVHYGHLKTIDSARRELDLPRVLILPNPQPPHKLAYPLTPYVHRKEMLRLALQEFPALEMADFEEQAIGPAYTTDTVRRVIASLPPEEQRELWLIVGMDSMIELPRWKDPEALFRDANVAVLPRPGFDIGKVDPHYLARVRVLKTPMLSISATEIRERLHRGQSVAGLIADPVRNYIFAHQLYQ
ncbi:MAG TPA: nicotinate (nicotinamide) nucleotide adenylyltransferase [bacterium]|jgi:nicotinate-nucleotide adenylyltransferase